jgi:hypothetical protein
MAYCGQFDRFNPFCDEPPFYPFEYLPNIVSRARALLNDRNSGQIKDIAENISETIDQFFADIKNQEIHRLGIPSEAQAEFDFSNIPTEQNTTDIEALKACASSWDFICEYAGIEDGKGQELFAVLSLWLVADAVAWIKGMQFDHLKPSILDLMNSFPELTSDERHFIASRYLFYALEAVCFGEQLKAIASTESDFLTEIQSIHGRYNEILAIQKVAERKRYEQWSKEMNFQRHKKNHDAKKRVVDEWSKDPSRFPSAEKAGVYFTEWLKSSGLSFEPRTVTTWIREYAKQNEIKLR